MEIRVFYKVGILSGFGNQGTTLGRNLFSYILHLHNQQYGILFFLMSVSFPAYQIWSY